ncbi:MAG TPA: hypothetical protein VHZ07_02430 [Bryobacteraceae bacterium]|nr:hypothetical protein [Bryobacteraceae bacterium]
MSSATRDRQIFTKTSPTAPIDNPYEDLGIAIHDFFTDLGIAA